MGGRQGISDYDGLVGMMRERSVDLVAFAECLPDKVAVLGGVHLFSRCDAMELAILARRCDVRTHPAGSVLVRAGERHHTMIVIWDGRVELHPAGPGEDELNAGGSIGELGLVTDVPHRLGASARTDVTALELSAREFHQLMRELPNIAIHVAAVLAEDVISGTRVLH